MGPEHHTRTSWAAGRDYPALRVTLAGSRSGVDAWRWMEQIIHLSWGGEGNTSHLLLFSLWCHFRVCMKQHFTHLTNCNRLLFTVIYCFYFLRRNGYGYKKRREDKFTVSHVYDDDLSWGVAVSRSSSICLVFVLQKASTQSPPPAQERAPSPNFELGLSSFPPLPGAAGNLKPETKTENSLENRLSDIITGVAKDKVSSLSLSLSSQKWYLGQISHSCI